MEQFTYKKKLTEKKKLNQKKLVFIAERELKKLDENNYDVKLPKKKQIIRKKDKFDLNLKTLTTQ